MLLGDLLARFSDEALALETVMGLGDVVLFTKVQERAEAEGLTLGAFARAAVHRYAADAPDEEWTTLLGALARAQDPGAVCMKRALMFSLDGAPAPAARPHD